MKRTMSDPVAVVALAMILDGLHAAHLHHRRRRAGGRRSSTNTGTTTGCSAWSGPSCRMELEHRRTFAPRATPPSMRR